MEDLFVSKNIKPMLLSESDNPFNSEDYIYELKLDGIRSVIYLDDKYVEIRNKRNLRLNATYPELGDIWTQVNKRCILDGELLVVSNGKPDFYELQRRSMMTNRTKIEFAANKYPVSFSAFDILYIGNEQITDKPLTERKEILGNTVKENNKIIVSRYIKEKGIDLYNLTVEQDLEGIVAKKTDSKYYTDKRSKDWIKIKNLKDEDFVICGYIIKPGNKFSLVLGAYNENRLERQGHVTLGVSGEVFGKIKTVKRAIHPFFDDTEDSEATWIEPAVVCTVKYMMKSSEGNMRQPVFKGLREDKDPKDCIIK